MSEQTSNKEKAATDIIQVGSEIAGGLGGLAIGVLGGPIAGAAAQPILARALRAAAEFAQRQLGHREKVRVGATITFAVARIEENRAQGLSLRQDDFFAEQFGERSAADEITEGVLLAAQQEHQEKKLRFFGNLLANIAFHEDVDRGTANTLLKLAEDLSYRQLCYLALMVRKGEFGLSRQSREINTYFTMDIPHNDLPYVSLANDVLELLQRNMLWRGQIDGVEQNIIANVTSFGFSLYELMNLSEIEVNDLTNIVQLLVEPKTADTFRGIPSVLTCVRQRLPRNM